MNSNYSWQKHQTNQRLQARFNEAEIHRSLKRDKLAGEQPTYSLGRIVILPLIGMVALMRRFMSHDRSKKPQSIQSV